ncbi:interleukin-23 receptor [Chaetodon trifascialis]|uniref:interleukin-23 receptor n=1 Tax=Chaetodon trifascialis TaxID=109706 RepID=UPI00399411DD
MSLHSTIWRFIIILLSFSFQRCPLLPADCQRFNGLGYLTVEPAPLFLIGSNLTVYCHVWKWRMRSKISLELNGQTIDPWKNVNCTTVMFKLVNVRTPLSIVRCKLHSDQLREIINGLDLHGGLPPDKPENILCEMSRNSDLIDCSWEAGQETHLPTAYNISVCRENGTQILLTQIQDAEEITIPRAMIDENAKYQLTITAYNHFGSSQSDPVILCVKDIVVPETPHIMQITFGSDSIAAMLQWRSAESSEHLLSDIRLRSDNGSWGAGEGTELSKGLIQVDGLKPLTEYEFQMRTCNQSQLRHTNKTSFTCTSSKKSFCSKWSPSVRGRSPGKGPSQQLHVWRIVGSQGTNRKQMVTVLWKPPSPQDYSGEVQQYKIFLGNDQKQGVTCRAALSQCSVQVPAEVQALSISAVTSYGASPPADVPLGHSGDFGPVSRELAPAANGSAVLVSWSWPGKKHWSSSGGELLHFVVEWTSVPEEGLQWRKLAEDQNSTFITGLTAGVRYNISLYAVTTRGVSAPSSGLVYSKEQKPVSAPNMLVLLHEARQIWIQWDELPVKQQRGFITNYTIYLQTLSGSKPELNVTVSGSEPRQKWLACPEGALALQLTASTSAGEGPRGVRVSSWPETPAVGLVFVIVFIITLFIAIIANLLCWSCVRERIKQKCVSWGPAWFDQNFPKPGNSIAIQLLKQDKSEQPLSSTYSDPPLSPISFISQDETDDMYPNIHVEVSQAGSGQPPVETPLLVADRGTMLVDSQLEHVSYKPQIAMLAPYGEDELETEEEQRDAQISGEEDRCSSVFGGLPGGFLPSVEVEFSGSLVGLTLSSVNSLLWPKPVLNEGFFLGRRGMEDNVEADSPSLDLQQGEMTICDTADACLCQYTAETTVTAGYFPQVAAVGSTALCDAQRQQGRGE